MGVISSSQILETPVTSRTSWLTKPTGLHKSLTAQTKQQRKDGSHPGWVAEVYRSGGSNYRWITCLGPARKLVSGTVVAKMSRHMAY